MSSKKQPEISVIVPVYNVEYYLNNCIESILRQTFRDFELILVDDGSTDESGRICEEYKEKSGLIRVLHQENRGLAEARNIGTGMAAGKWLTWIDSDDFVDPEYLEILLKLAEKNQTDLAVGEFLFCREGETDIPQKGSFETGVCSGKEAFRRMLLGTMHGTSACGMLMRTELARKFPFPAGRYHEDDLNTYRFFLDTDRVAYTQRPLYCYVQRAESIMHRRYGRMDRDELDAADELLIQGKLLGPEYRSAAIYKTTHNYWDVAKRNKDLRREEPETWQRIRRFFRKYHLEILRNPYISKRMKADIFLYQMGRNPA